MSIKQRIYWSFFVLVFLFVVNSIASIITLNNNKKLSDGILKVTDPSLLAIQDFEDILVASKMYTTNWVFLRSSQEDKDALRKLHNIDYPKAKQRLNTLSAKWDDKPSEDSLNKIFAGFEQLLRFEKKIMASLQKFEDYDDPMKRLQAEQIVEDELLPRTSTLITALLKIEATGQELRIQKNKYLGHSSMLLRTFISVLAVTIICIGIFLSLYMAKIIVGPINKIRHIVNDLGKGITRKVNYKISTDEIGEMVRSINNLSEKLHSSAAFANEIGNGNFNSHFEPLGPDDTLGKAIIAMRDNLKSSDDRMTEAQHIAKLGSWEWDLKTNELFWSDETHNIFDTDPRTFSPSFEGYMSFVHPEDREHTNRLIVKCLQDHQPFSNELRLISNKNVAKLLLAQGKVITNHEGEVIKMFGTGQDITERKRGEEKLAEEQELLRIIIENIPDQIYVKDIEGRFLLCNLPGAINAGCKSQADIIGKTDFDFFPQDDAKHYFEVEQALIKSGKSLISQEDYVPDKTGKPYWTLNTKVPIKDRSGKMIGLIGINRDITKRKHDEELLQKSQVSLELNNRKLEQKNKELEQFAYVASHDLQEPLRTTISFVEIFKKQYFGKLDLKADKYLSYIVEASDRMRVLIKDLLDFSRIGINKDMEKVDCNLILRDVIMDLDKAVKDSSADITSEHLPVISGYATELKQLFQNLILNSIKFRKKNVALKINIEAKKKNDYWQFAFTDNGIGIDEQHNERIFIIFQRLHTRSEYQGSGIGLSHCKKIVELHHGKIWVESTPNKGSTFYFTIHSPKEKTNEPQVKLYNAHR